MTQQLKTYSELITINGFVDRCRYLMTKQSVGELTFGGYRQLNQALYSSVEWRRCRDKIILRDNGCDLAIPGRDIHDRIYVHHINPISVDDIIHRSPSLFDPNNLITVSRRTHEIIHYGNDPVDDNCIVERRPNDTCPWR